MQGYLDLLPIELRTELKWYCYGPVLVSAWVDSRGVICAFLNVHCEHMHTLAFHVPVEVDDLRRFLQGPDETIHTTSLVIRNEKRGVQISGVMGYAVFTRAVSDVLLDKLRRVVDDYRKLLRYLPTDY